jgi:hypothetical protein
LQATGGTSSSSGLWGGPGTTFTRQNGITQLVIDNGQALGVPLTLFDPASTDLGTINLLKVTGSADVSFSQSITVVLFVGDTSSNITMPSGVVATIQACARSICASSFAVLFGGTLSLEDAYITGTRQPSMYVAGQLLSPHVEVTASA